MRRLIFIVILFSCIAPALGDTQILYTFDLSYTKDLSDTKRIWDETHFVSTLQGIVNRHDPNLYVYFTGDQGFTDKFWLKYMQESGFIKGEITQADSIKSLAYAFKDKIKGLVVYDGNVPATSNAASTVAGVEDLAAVRYDPSPDSLFYLLVKDPNGLKMPVKKWLVNKDGTSLFTGKGIIPETKSKSTGSAKCDVYIWAKEKYLDTGKCNPRIMGYYVDSYCIPQLQGTILSFHTLVNHDYIVANRGFVFDLSPWDDETPVDDRTQKIGTDYTTFAGILKSAYDRLNGHGMIGVSGFIPLWFKYTNIANAGGKHEPVYGEFRLAALLTSYNAYMDADAVDRPSMANASIFRRFPLKSNYKQAKPTIESLKKRGFIDPNGKVVPKAYVSMYMGDYDSAAWMYYMIPRVWDDPARGTIPLGWAFNPNLAERFPVGMHYVRTNASQNDFFVTGASGAGYIHPEYLTPPQRISELPPGLDAWEKHCKHWMSKFDISIVGFIIDGFASPPMRTPDDHPKIWDTYSRIAPDGISGQFIRNTGVHKEMPYVPMEWQYEVPGSERLYRQIPQDTYNDYADFIIRRGSKIAPSFAYYRTILWHPSEIKTLMDLVKSKSDGDNIEFVDPYTMMLLIKQSHELGQQPEILRHGIWEIDVSSEILAHSGVVDGYDIRDLFGRGFGRVESDAVAFKDGVGEPFTHWVEWKTKHPVQLEGFNLFARGDRWAGREDVREFNAFRLYGKHNTHDDWTLLDSYVPPHPYPYKHSAGDEPAPLRSVMLDKPFVGTYFRAEFDQYDSNTDPKRGPRIVELEGIGSIAK